LVPSRDDLALWLLQAAKQGVQLQGASDHLVSEAIYLADPEGNGIEVYRDRPSSEWIWRDSMVQMATRALDLNELVRSVRTREWSGLPPGSSIGHVHLQVGALGPAEAFYAGLLGYDVVSRIPGATFLSSGGYHHHLAANIWNSTGVPARPPGSTGLASLELIPAERAIWTRIVERHGEPAAAGGMQHVSLKDPWGTTVLIRTT
jgi:catechol 2,3-dioxygenase